MSPGLGIHLVSNPENKQKARQSCKKTVSEILAGQLLEEALQRHGLPGRSGGGLLSVQLGATLGAEVP